MLPESESVSVLTAMLLSQKCGMIHGNTVSGSWNRAPKTPWNVLGEESVFCKSYNEIFLNTPKQWDSRSSQVGKHVHGVDIQNI